MGKMTFLVQRKLALHLAKFLVLATGSCSIFTAGITSCGTDDSSSMKDTTYADKEFLNWWWFEVGSWWVYKRIDDTSAIFYDTVIVRLKTTETVNEPRISDSIIRVYILHLTHSSQYFKEKGSLNNQILSTIGTYGTALSSTSHTNTLERLDYFIFNPILHWPLKHNFNEMDHNGVTLLDSNRLANPILDHPTLHYTNGLTSGEIWITESIGITKYKFGYDNSIWELVDYETK